MSEKILSVIIPSYNSKPYLDKCLASLIVPDRMDQMDIIVVNDGSTDGSEAITMICICSTSFRKTKELKQPKGFP